MQKENDPWWNFPNAEKTEEHKKGFKNVSKSIEIAYNT